MEEKEGEGFGGGRIPYLDSKLEGRRSGGRELEGFYGYFLLRF